MSVGKCCGVPETCRRNCDFRLDWLDGRPLDWLDGLPRAVPQRIDGATLYSDTKPEYYNAGPDDLIAFALKHDLGAIEFTIMRYVMRWKKKQPLLSLRKAREYLDRLIANEEERLAREHPPMASTGDTGG